MWLALQETYEKALLKAIVISNYFDNNYVDFINSNRIKPMRNQLKIHLSLQRCMYLRCASYWW